MKPIKINLPSLVLSLALIGMLLYISIDAIVTKPQIKQTVERVSNNYDSLTVVLNAKLPEIDSALFVHTNQIFDQSKQLEELKKLIKLFEEK